MVLQTFFNVLKYTNFIICHRWILKFFSKCFTILRILARAVSFFCRSITLALLNFCVSSHLHCSVRLTQVALSANTANTTGSSGITELPVVFVYEKENLDLIPLDLVGIQMQSKAAAVCSVNGGVLRLVRVVHHTILAVLDVGDRKSTRLNSSHSRKSRMPSSA